MEAQQLGPYVLIKRLGRGIVFIIYIVFKGGPYVVDPPLDDEHRITDGRSAQSQADIVEFIEKCKRTLRKGYSDRT